jgi:hypothetical protein
MRNHAQRISQEPEFVDEATPARTLRPEHLADAGGMSPDARLPEGTSDGVHEP